MVKRSVMSVEVAVELLKAMQCDTDSVVVLNRNANFRVGEEVELSQLDEFQFLLSPYTAKESAHQIDATRVKIEYYGNSRDVSGTLRDMVIDRLRMFGGWQRLIRAPKVNRAKPR